MQRRRLLREMELRNFSVQEVRVREIPWALGFEQGRR